MLELIGCTVDLHGTNPRFFDIPVDNLFATPILLDMQEKKKVKKLYVLLLMLEAERARAFGKLLGVGLNSR